MSLVNGAIYQNLENIRKGGGIPVSMEVTPPTAKSEMQCLLQRIDDVYSHFSFQFCAVTWHLRNFPSSYGLSREALQLAHELRIRNKEVLLHIAAKGLTKVNITQILDKLVSMNVSNIFALRGDTMENCSDFPHAENLVKFIREYDSTQFDICVAGYPNGHPEALSYLKDLYYLRKKVNAGANFIITQIILEETKFLSFLKDCKVFGINVPILAGIMPIQDYFSFQRMMKLCHICIPKHIEAVLESIKENPETVRRYGIFHAVTMIKTILSSGNKQGFHFFTLNRMPAILEILKYTGLSIASPARSLRMIPRKLFSYTRRSDRNTGRTKELLF